jgi:protein transport protein SEC24
MLVVSDTDDIFLPKPMDLLLNSECKARLEALLNQRGLNPATQQSYFRSLQKSGLLQAASPFYKTFAIECLRAQVSVDMFLLSSVYQDVTSLGESWCYIMH